MKKILIVIYCIFLFYGCRDSKIKLFVFDCGENEVKDISLFSPGLDEGVTKKLVVSCYLIQHPKGNLMWDTGLSDSLILKPNGVQVREGIFTLKVHHKLSSQLEQIKVDPTEIEYLAFSHMHPDHSGNANLFLNSKLLIQKEEYQAAFLDDASKYSFNKETYNRLHKKNIKVLDGDYDVFGDGNVIIKKAPGHTPGHQVLFINLEQTGPILLSGDLYHFRKNREYRRVPGFNYNKEKSLESMDKIESFLIEKKATLWIQHDPDRRRETQLSPNFYE